MQVDAPPAIRRSLQDLQFCRQPVDRYIDPLSSGEAVNAPARVCVQQLKASGSKRQKVLTLSVFLSIALDVTSAKPRYLCLSLFLEKLPDSCRTRRTTSLLKCLLATVLDVLSTERASFIPGESLYWLLNIRKSARERTDLLSLFSYEVSLDSVAKAQVTRKKFPLRIDSSWRET